MITQLETGSSKVFKRAFILVGSMRSASWMRKTLQSASKGGISVAISELCMKNNIGCKIEMTKIPSEKMSNDRILFSESHSRYLLVAKNKDIIKISKFLKNSKVSFSKIGLFGGDQIFFDSNTKAIIDLSVDKVQKIWMRSLEELVRG